MWAPPAPSDDAEPEPPHRGPEGRAAQGRHRHFLTYVGKLCKPYIEPPMTLLRYTMWAHLRAHPNVTFLAVDVPWVVTPYLPTPVASAPPKCHRCSFHCKQCLSLPPATAALPLSVGTVERVGSKAEYKALLANSTFCLVLRGDNGLSARPGRHFTSAHFTSHPSHTSPSP